MTYHEITIKLHRLTMTPNDWAWLDNYCKENCSDPSTYRKIVLAYQARENENMLKCYTDFGICSYCGKNFVCSYKGFCARQIAM